MMDFLSLGAVELSSGYLSAITKQQHVNSANVANAHTPGYTAKSAEFSELLSQLSPFENELSRRMSSMGSETDTGQPVDLAKEMIKMQENSLNYSVASRRLATVFTILKSASQVGR
jgi:flagellar basal body rod protein FlgB